MKDDYLIFDFDGTIADTLPSMLAIFNRIGGEYGLPKIKKTDIEKFRGISIREALKELSIPIYRLPFVVKRGREELAKEVENLKPIKGLKPVLQQLNRKRRRMGILSSNSESNVKKFLQKNNLDFFDFIYAGSSIFGKDKVLKRLLKEKNLSADQVVYIGDETRDIEAAKKCKVRVLSVGWGFSTPAILKANHPDWLITKPKDLLTIFASK